MNIEMAYVGVLLSDSRHMRDYYNNTIEIITDRKLRDIYSVMKSEYEKNQTYDAIIISENLQSDDRKKIVTELQKYKQYSNNINVYAKELNERHKK